MDWNINWTNCQEITILPRKVVKEYIHQIEYHYMKVLLLIFSNNGESIREADLAKELQISEEVIREILLFWKKKGILSFVGQPEVVPVPKQPKREEILTLKQDEVTQMALEDETVKFLLNEVQNMLGRTMTYSECNILISIYKLYGLPCDVVCMLIQYCISQGKTHFNYVRKVAMDWSNREIVTFEKAEQYMMLLERQATSEQVVKNLLGIRDRDLTGKERNLADLWVGEQGVSLELVLEAFERCVGSTGKLSFPYMDKIIQGWREKGYHTLQEVKLEKEKRVSQKRKEEKFSSYDIHQMEELMMQYLPVYEKEDRGEV